MSLKVQARGKTLYVMGTLLGQRVRISTGLPIRHKKQAEIIKIQTEDAIVKGKVMPNQHQTFSDYISAYEVSLENSKGSVPTTERRILSVLEHAIGNCRLDKLTTNHLTRHVVSCWDDVQQNSRSRYITILNAVINYGNNEYGGTVKTYPNKKIDDTRSMHFTQQEAKKFLELAKPSIYYMDFMYLIFLGVRLGELKKMELDGTRVFVYDANGNSKTVDRILPIPILLQEAIADRGFQPLSQFKNVAEASLKLNAFLRMGCIQVGIEKAMRVHDLRHTFAYLMATRGADLAELQFLLGHKDIRMTMKYRGFIPSKAEAVASNLLGGCITV